MLTCSAALLTCGTLVSVLPGPSPVAHPTVRAAEVTGPTSVNPLVVVQDTGHAKGLPTREADVLLLLSVDAHVVA